LREASGCGAVVTRRDRVEAWSWPQATNLGERTMATETTDALASWTGLAKQATEQITGCTQEAVTNYFNWLRNTVSASPWSDTDLNKKLLSHASESLIAGSAFIRQLGGAENVEDAVKIQIEFVKTQMDSFNQRAKELGELYTKMATAATKTPPGMSA
jgi:hypothetical protein